jgi:hypothetical protein
MVEDFGRYDTCHGRHHDRQKQEWQQDTTQTQFTGGDQTVTRCLYTFITARQGDGWVVTGIRDPSFDCAIGDLN